MNNNEPSQKATYCQVQKFKGNEGLTYFFQVAVADKPDDVCIVPLEEEKFNEAYLEVRRFGSEHEKIPFIHDLAQEFHRAATDGKALKDRLAAEQEAREEEERMRNARNSWVAKQYGASDPAKQIKHVIDIKV